MCIRDRYWGNKTYKETSKTENWSEHPENESEQKVGPRYYNVPSDKENELEIKQSQIKDRNENKSISNAEEKSVTVTPTQKKTVDLLTSKTGGAYIPPAKLRMMQANITDKSRYVFCILIVKN